jgi:hypothetical protein
VVGNRKNGPAPGFCPYCGHLNPADYRFCLSCRRPLPRAGVARVPPPTPAPMNEGSPVAREPVDAAAAEPGPAPPTPADEPPVREGGAWYLIPIAIAIVALVALAAFWFLQVYLHSGPPARTAGPGSWARTDLCITSNGTNCAGNLLSVPWNNHGAYRNATACDPFSSLGSSEVLWLNYTASATVVGIVIPSSEYYGATGWFEDPSGFVNNTTAMSRSAWYSGYSSGTYSAAIPIPDDGQLWCVGWWEPAGSVSIQWQSDLAITYFGSG